MSEITTRNLFASLLVVVVAIGFQPATAFAHPGHDAGHGLVQGAQHPFTGLDHLCAMVAVGIWAAQRGGRAVWLVPVSFLVAMCGGSALAMSGVRLPYVEPGIALSLVVFGLLVANSIRLPLAVGAGIVSAFALVHGYAHGAELPVAASGLTYAIGFFAATASLLVMGVGLGKAMSHLQLRQLARVAGIAIAAFGIYLVIR